MQQVKVRNQNQRSGNWYLLREVMNFIEIFWKNVTYDDIKKD